MLHKCESNNLSEYVFSSIDYIEQQTQFISEPKSKQILRYGEYSIGIYENIPKEHISYSIIRLYCDIKPLYNIILILIEKNISKIIKFRQKRNSREFLF